MNLFEPFRSMLAIRKLILGLMVYLAGELSALKVALATSPSDTASIVGITVVPHHIVENMRYRRARDLSLSAKVQLFVRGSALPQTFNGKTPAEQLQSGEWAWHDMNSAVEPPEGAMTVWTWNGKSSRWGVGHSIEIAAKGIDKASIPIVQPDRWLSAVTFLSSDGSAQPDMIFIHVANETELPFDLTGLRLWLPESNSNWRILWPQPILSVDGRVPARDRGFIKVVTNKLPLTYAALELQTSNGPLWAHLRIKREAFDISGGWINDTLTHEPYLKQISQMHVNTGQIDYIRGYTDQPALYDRYPMKLFNRLWPLERWDTDDWLLKIHAVEFIGEPQYGGGKPLSPQEVFDLLLPYRTSRLPTSVTLSEERTWRWYAGLSDYPHYDAYRVVAPSADAWSEYDRWGGRRIRWGAPLETIGDMSRSLRELSRPVPCAYWSQGPHDGWGGGFLNGGRSRRSPTPEELRSQAMHALSTRITSLYWFNLSLKSLLRFPDTWESITRIGREIRMLEPFYLEGDAYHFERTTRDGVLDWDLATIAAPEAAVLFANDLAYAPDEKENVFKFKSPRLSQFEFRLPHWLRDPIDVFRVDADGIHKTKWQGTKTGVLIEDTRHCDGLYIATKTNRVRNDIERRRQAALARETANEVDRNQLETFNK